MKSYFEDKTIWITGASSGIGKEIARQIVAFNPERLILSARSVDKLEEFKSHFPNQTIEIVPLDLLNYNDVYSQASQWVQKNGRVDILFNNGGISQRSSAEETDISVYRKLIDVNFFGSIAITKAVLPEMVRFGHGHIVTTSSVVGKIGSPMRSGYAASKHALHGFFDSLRAEVPKSIKISMVMPGYIRTDISKNAVVGDGSKHGKMDTNQEKGMDVEVMVAQMLKAISLGKSEIIIGGSETLGIYIGRFFPRILEKVLKNIKVTDQ